MCDSRPVNWGQLVQLGTDAMSPIGKQMIFGSAAEVRVRLRLGLCLGYWLGLGN